MKSRETVFKTLDRAGWAHSRCPVLGEAVGSGWATLWAVVLGFCKAVTWLQNRRLAMILLFARPPGGAERGRRKRTSLSEPSANGPGTNDTLCNLWVTRKRLRGFQAAEAHIVQCSQSLCYLTWCHSFSRSAHLPDIPSECRITGMNFMNKNLVW